jgi:hypothetical protein
LDQYNSCLSRSSNSARSSCWSGNGATGLLLEQDTSVLSASVLSFSVLLGLLGKYP